MNRLKATLQTLKEVDSLHQLTFKLGEQNLHLLTLELNHEMELGSTHPLGVKSTDIAIAKNLSGELSYLNQLEATVISIHNGVLLSSIVLDIEGFKLESVIPYQAVISMDLQIGDEVVALVRGSEVSVLG